MCALTYKAFFLRVLHVFPSRTFVPGGLPATCSRSWPPCEPSGSSRSGQPAGRITFDEVDDTCARAPAGAAAPSDVQSSLILDQRARAAGGSSMPLRALWSVHALGLRAQASTRSA